MNSAKDTITVAIVGVIAACAPVVLVMIGVERSMNWMEERFGSEIAALAAFILIGMIALTVGILLAVKVMKHTLNAFTDGLASVEESRGKQAAVQREYARQDREQLAAYAKIQTIDVQRVNRLAQQQAGLLVDTERQRWDMQQAQQDAARQPVAAWAQDDDGDGDSYRHYE